MTESRTRSSIAVLALAGCTLFSGAATAAHAAGGPQVGPNVQVNDPQLPFPEDQPSRNSTTIAASENGKNILIGWDDFQGFCGTQRPCVPAPHKGISGYGFSTDGGITWTDGGPPPLIGLAETAGHPWVDRGGEEGNETFYFVSRMRTNGSNVFSAGIGIHRGHFAAGTFVWDDGQILTPPDPNDFYGRQAIAAAKDNSGAAYIVQANVLGLCGINAFGGGQIEVFRTHDAGDSWQGPAVVSPDLVDVKDPNDPNCGNSGFLQIAPHIAIGDKGEVYAIWQHGPYVLNAAGQTTPDSRIAFSRSLDGGVTWSAPVFLANLNTMRENPPVGYAKNRMNDQPRIAVATTGKHHGRIYVTFYAAVAPVASAPTAQTSTSSDIYITYSDNRGATWSAPAPLTTPVPNTGVKRFWPTVAVRPGGVVDVLYMESLETQVTPDPTDVECSVLIGGGQRRTGPLSSLVDTYLVQSRDGGVTFGAPIRVSEVTTNWCTPFFQGVGALYSNFGDYLGLATGGNRSFAAWPDGRNDVVDVFFAEVKGKDKK